jgi:hypothetical protein
MAEFVPGRKQERTIEEIRAQIDEEFNKEGLHRIVQNLASDQHRRIIRKNHPAVLTWEPDPVPTGEYYNLKPLPGSVTILWASRGSELLRHIENAYASRDIETLRTLGERVARDTLRRSVISIREAVDQLIDAPVYFEFRYNGKTQARNLALINGIDIACLPFPYNGGRLREDDFTIVEYYRPRHRAEYDYFVLIAPPRLTELEKIALEAVPADQLEMNLGAAGKCWGWCAATVVAVVVLTVVVACGPICAKLDSLSLSEEVLKRLGPIASARELVNMRRELFLEGNL